jgi:hypothetical protein
MGSAGEEDAEIETHRRPIWIERSVMFAEPTINDFLARVDWHLQKARDRALSGVNEVRARATAHGALQGSRTVLFTTEAVRKEFDAGVETVLGELKRAIRTTRLDRGDLRQQAVQRLLNFAIWAKSAANTPDVSALGMSQNLDREMDALNQHLQFAVRQFDVGLFDPAEPEVPALSNNSITIGNMTGSTIQQGSPGAKQSVRSSLNIESAVAALATFETAIKQTNLPATTLGDLMVDVRTIRDQLSKSSPTPSIIQEAGRSLRNIMEGITGGILTPGVIAAAPALWSALGLG